MASKYRVTGTTATNVAIGDKARVIVSNQMTVQQHRAQVDALGILNNLAAALPSQRGDLTEDDYKKAKKKIAATKRELTGSEIHGDRVKRLIKKLTAALMGATALTNAVVALQAAVAQLFSGH